MLCLSQSEKQFIRNSILNNKRLDSRNNQQSRGIHIAPNNIPQSDFAVLISNGDTDIEIILKFESNEGYQIRCNICIDALNIISKILENQKIGLDLNINIIKNGGGVTSLVFEGLKYIFKSIRLPNLDNLKYDIKYSIDLPTCKTYAIFDSSGVLDPIKQEEDSCDGLIHVFILNDRVVGSEIENASNIDYFVLEEVLQYN